MNTPLISQETKQEIVRIAIIDDAFDNTFDDVTETEIDSFWESISNERNSDYKEVKDEVESFTKNIGKDIKEKSDIDNEILKYLWEERDKLPALKSIIEKLFYLKIDKIQPLYKIIEAIDDCKLSLQNLDFIVDCHGSDVNIEENLTGVDIILLDYRLGSGIDDSPIDNARKIAKEIYEVFDSASKLPLLILMSSDQNIFEHQETFRKSTKWLKGLFYCSPKNDLADKENIELNLLIWKEQAKEGLKIYEFVESVIESLEENKENFVEAIKDLSLEDYSYVNNFSLKTEGQPLGEYMLWLFSCYLGDIVFDKNLELWNKQLQINSITNFDSPPKVAQLSPSMHLVDMYESSLFKIFSDNNIDVDVRQGTTFINKDSKKVLMVLNAECDLLRQPIPNVTLIEGGLNEISKSDQLREQDIKLLRLDKKFYRVNWKWKSAKTIEYEKVTESLKNDGFIPYGILRTPFFYKVQQFYVNQFSRVGLPVTPPIYQQTKVEFFSRLQSNPICISTENTIFLLSKKRQGSEKFERECHFTTEFIKELRQELHKIIHNPVDESGKTIFKKGKVDTLVSRLKKLNAYFVENPSKIIKEYEVVSLFDNTVGVTLNTDIGSFDEWKEYYLVINIITESSFSLDSDE